MADIEALRKQLSKLGRYKSTRDYLWTKQCPCDWSPESVFNPSTEMYFTATSAWELICELLDNSDHPFEAIVMETPPGQIALVTKVALSTTGPVIYIKLHLHKGRALCRSFHADLSGR